MAIKSSIKYTDNDIFLLLCLSKALNKTCDSGLPTLPRD